MSGSAIPANASWRLTPWKIVAAVILVLGAYSAVVRYASGLGAATHLSNEFPWGLWIGFDVLVGVGLAAGGFVIAATVHVFRIKAYGAIARPTILTAFLGYLLVIFALMFDLGRPARIWHPLVMWNPHSVMFEVGWCVMLYTTVLALEFSPLVFERVGWERPLKWVHAVYVPLVIVGVLLSTMHQSSLGTLYVIAPDKLHGLWYTPLLPVFFFISAIAGGLAMTIFESFMTFRAFGKRLEAHLLRGLGRIIVVVLAVYAIWRLEDLASRGQLELAFAVTAESVLFWGEMLLGVLLPAVLFAIPRVRHREAGLFLAALLTILGFVVNRMNVAITGMAASSGVRYVPSWMEFAVTMSVVVLGFILFGLAVKYLSVFPREELPALMASGRRRGAWRTRPALSRAALLTLWGLLLIGFAAVAHTRDRQDEASPPPERGWTAEAASLTSLPAPYVFPASEDSPGPVTFRHESHVDADSPNCASCHAGTFSLTTAGRPRHGDLDYERVHEGDLCAGCHDGQQAFAVNEDCTFCHAI
jgi:c(7)-type cytochrome triheme protein